MSDLGQDPDSLRIRLLEVEVTIEEKKFAKKRIALEKMKLENKIKEYDKSIVSIDEQISSHSNDYASLKNALKELSEQ